MAPEPSSSDTWSQSPRIERRLPPRHTFRRSWAAHRRAEEGVVERVGEGQPAGALVHARDRHRPVKPRRLEDEVVVRRDLGKAAHQRRRRSSPAAERERLLPEQHQTQMHAEIHRRHALSFRPDTIRRGSGARYYSACPKQARGLAFPTTYATALAPRAGVSRPSRQTLGLDDTR